ncbi:MAG: methyltransferase domain-containing protein [Magnetococcus sp. DMHC-6]
MEDKNSNFSSMSTAMANTPHYVAWIISLFRPYIGQRLLEVGIGFGNYKTYLPDLKGYTAIDIDPAAIIHARKNNPDGDYRLGNINDIVLVEQLQNVKFDTLMCINVLEHVEEDQVAFSNMLKIVQEGTLLIFVPAFPFLYSDLDRLAGHYRRYTKSSLRRMVSKFNVHIERIEYFNPIGGLGWLANKWIRHQNLNEKSIQTQVQFFDRYIVPLSRLLGILTRHFFGQSLICVIRTGPQEKSCENITP